MATGDLIKLGTLYMNGAIRQRPTAPIAGGSGNIPAHASSWAIEIRDTDSADANKMQWVEINEGGKKYLVSDRVVVTASWSSLNSQSLIAGKVIVIDGKYYKVRSLTGGTDRRTTNNHLGATPSSNEWDKWIGNELGLPGLPTPTATDRDATVNEVDNLGEHNQKWNWYNTFSWGQELYTVNNVDRIIRGHSGAQYVSAHSPSSTSPGWRPVLEEIDMNGVVTPNNYSTAGNGGRKLVRLSNGWEVAVTIKDSSQLYFYVRKGADRQWEQLCYVANASNYPYSDVSIVAKGTDVHLIASFYNNATVQNSVSYAKIDVLTQSNVNAHPTGMTAIDLNQTVLGKVSLAINQDGTELHAAWASKNSTYANPFNIRYAKGTINADGSVTWGAAEQVTTFNSTSASNFATSPSIVVRNYVPYIFIAQQSRYLYQTSAASGAAVTLLKRDNSLNPNTHVNNVWSYRNITEVNNTYPQLYPSAVVDKDGVIHVAWEGSYSTYNRRHIYYAFSIDGGANWSTPTIVSEQSLIHKNVPSISVDKNNKVFIMYTQQVDTDGNGTGDYNKLMMVTKANNVISQPITIVDNVNYGFNLNPSTLFDVTFTGQFGETPPTIYGTTTSVNYIGTYSTNQAPTVPGSFTKPQAGSTLFVKKPIEVQWGASTDADNDPIVYQLEVSLNGGSYTPYNEQTTTSRTIDVLTTNVIITQARFRVRAKDSQGQYSDYLYSDTFMVSHNNAPTVSLTSEVSKQIYNHQDFAVKGFVQDLDIGNNLTVKYKVNGGSEKVLAELVANGQPQAFEKALRFESLTLKDGETVVANVSEGVQTISVWAVDSVGGTSEVKTVNFTAIANTLPEIRFVEAKGENGNVLVFEAYDEDGSVRSVEVYVNGSLQKTFEAETTNFMDSFDVTILPNMLFEGDKNALKVVATDNKGAKTSLHLKLALYLPLTPFVPDTHNFSIEGALSITGASDVERFADMAHKVVGIDLVRAEVQLMGSSARNAKTTQRFTMKRTNSDVNYNVNLVTGAIE